LYFLPEWNRRFELSAEVSDVSRDRVVQGRHLDKAFAAAGAHLAVTKWLWLGARVEDIFERSSFQAYLNIIFRDQDLGYIFGLASVAR
jgi:hypothetical protein